MKLYTVDEAAKALRVSPHTVRNWCHSKKLKYRVKREFDHGSLRRYILILDTDLKDFLDSWLPVK